jgi:hypothetical protein
MRLPIPWLVPCVVLTASCSSTAADGASGPEAIARDTTAPYPIDAPANASGPSTYKQLALRLTERAAPQVTPVNGMIGVVCVGMSNANQECTRLIAATDVGGPWAAEKSPTVRVVNCAVGSHAIERWIDPAYDATLWRDCIDRKLGLRGVRVDQVRVILHKAANQFGLASNGTALPLYPATGSNFSAFQRNLDAFAARVRSFFPSVQAVYSSSRSYGGYTTRSDRGEPQSYEEGHALNAWLASHATVDSVWYGWWGYLWAPACATGVSNGSGVCYDRTDFVDDAVHPSAGGEVKIARIQHDRLRRESWYRP